MPKMHKAFNNVQEMTQFECRKHRFNFQHNDKNNVVHFNFANKKNASKHHT